MRRVAPRNGCGWCPLTDLRGLVAAGLVVASMGVGANARAQFVITPTFDTSITSDPNAAAIEGVINNAIQTYENTFTNNVNVQITFREMTTGLGQSNFSYYFIPYTAYRSALVAGAKSADDFSAIATLPNTPNNPVNGSPDVDVKTALVKALGGFGTGYSGTDGTIGLNTHITDVGSPGTSGQYSLRAVTQHEIDEILGLGSALPGTGNGNPYVEDLFRYSAPGVRSYSTTPNTSPQPYLSIDGGNTSLVQYNTVSGGDFGDYNGVGGPHVQDAFATPGASPILGVELRALDVIGYDRAAVGTPEPGAVPMLVLAAAAAAGYGVWSRKSRIVVATG